MGDVQRMLRANLAVTSADRVALVTITAPGAEVLPWSQDFPGRVVPECAVEWNRTAAQRWSALNRACRERLRRAGHKSPLLSYVWQLQRRGLLHLHLVLAFGHGEDEQAARAYVAALKELARNYGFGFVDFRDRDGKAGRSSVMPREIAAGYLSRYSAKGGQLAEAAALEPGARPRRLLYVARSLTARSLVTMRRLRRVRYLWWIRRGQSSVLARAGSLPRWFGDSDELAAVIALAAP